MTQPTPSSDDTFKDSLNFVKKLWGGMNVPGMNSSVNMPGMAAMQSMGMPVPTVSIEELDKRIQELKSVEGWLNVNLTMLHNTIQALEIQRATIATLHSLSSTMAQSMQSANPTEGEKRENINSGKEEAPGVSPLVSQSAAWWNAVQEQFKQALGTALAKSAANAEAERAEDKQVEKSATPVGAKSKPKSGVKTKSARTTIRKP